VKTEEVIDWLADQEQFWNCISVWESISNGARIRTYPKEEITWSFLWYRDQLMYLFLDGPEWDPRLAIGLQWIFDNTDRILFEMHATNFSSDWISLPERVQFVAAFCAQSLSRFALAQGSSAPRGDNRLETT